LAFSRYLRLDPARGPAFVRAAEALLDAGADPNSGFPGESGEGLPAIERVIYGAAGVAHHAELTRLLLARGADPNDGETAYHAPETLDDRALRVVVESGKLDPEGLTTMLHRKLDWHHFEGFAWLLAHGADPNRPNHHFRCSSAFHHALDRCNGRRYFELLLNHGGDPTLRPAYHEPVAVIAAQRGRADLLDLFRARGFACVLVGDDLFLETCARGDLAAARRAVAADPQLLPRVVARDPALLAEFAGAGNNDGVRVLLDLGLDVDARTGRGGALADTALQVAVWRGRLATVKLLLERGADRETTNGRGETPLSLAVRALTDRSEWTPHASSEIVAALLAAGARVDSVRRFPTGSADADALLRRFGQEG
jgi:ankyrin repeat protein